MESFLHRGKNTIPLPYNATGDTQTVGLYQHLRFLNEHYTIHVGYLHITFSNTFTEDFML